MTLIDRIKSNIEKHALAAQSSEYDRTVAITAIACARQVIDDVISDPSRGNFSAELLAQLDFLHSNYNDPDGIYTNGKGVLGSLIADIEIELDLSEPQ